MTSRNLFTYHKDDGPNVLRQKDRMKAMGVRSMTPKEAEYTFLDTYWDRDVVDGKDWTCDKSRITYSDLNSHGKLRAFPTYSIQLWRRATPSITKEWLFYCHGFPGLDEDLVKEMAKSVCLLLNRIPFDIDSQQGPPRGLGHVVNTIVWRRVNPTGNTVIDPATLRTWTNQGKDKYTRFSFCTTIPYCTPGGDAAYWILRRNVSLTDGPNCTSLPDGFELREHDARRVPQEWEKACEMVTLAMATIQAQCLGMITSLESLKRHTDELWHQYFQPRRLLQKQRWISVHIEHAFTSTRTKRPGFVIRPRGSIAVDAKKAPGQKGRRGRPRADQESKSETDTRWVRNNFRLQVFGHDLTAVECVLDHFNTVLDNRPDKSFVHAWLEAAAVADYVNDQVEDGNWERSACKCVDHELDGHLTESKCADCLVRLPCAERVRSYKGTLVCSTCASTSLVRARTVVQALIEHKVNVAISSALRNDVEWKKISVDERNDFQRCVRDIMKYVHIDRLEYYDAYRNKWVEIALIVEGSVSNKPDSFSIEGFSHTVIEDGCYRYHTAFGNIGLVAWALNLLKAKWPAGILEKLRQYVVELDKIRSTLPNPYAANLFRESVDIRNLQHRFVSEVGNVCSVLRRKLVTLRANPDTSLEEYEVLRREWLSMKLANRQSTNMVKHMFVNLNMTNLSVVKDCPWEQQNNPEWRNLNQAINDIELRFNREGRLPLVRAADGAPWGGSIETLPKGYCRRMLYWSMNDKIQMMTKACNRWYPTNETPESLSAEYIYQSMTDEVKYAEFLGLPRVFWGVHPCRISIGHRQHGRQMRSGWPRNPCSLLQRKDNSDDGENMLFETWSSNVFKYNFSEDQYTILHQLLRDVDLPVHVFDAGALDPSETADHTTIGELDDLYCRASRAMQAAHMEDDCEFVSGDVYNETKPDGYESSVSEDDEEDIADVDEDSRGTEPVESIDDEGFNIALSKRVRPRDLGLQEFIEAEVGCRPSSSAFLVSDLVAAVKLWEDILCSEADIVNAIRIFVLNAGPGTWAFDGVRLRRL